MFQRLVLLMGMPRSGTSWLGQIFDSCPQIRFRLSPLFSYEFKNQLTAESSREDWLTVMRGAYASNNEFMSQTQRRDAGQYPTFPHKDRFPPVLVVKDTRFHDLTELALELFSDLRVVAIVRHPAAAINSWLRAPKEFPSDASPLEHWRSGACRKTGFGEFWGFDDWQLTTRLYLRLAKERPSQVMIQRYEHLVADALGNCQRMFDFCDLTMTTQTRDFLSASQSRTHPGEYSVYKEPSVVDAWRAQLPEVIQAEILSALRGTELETFVS